MRIQRGDRGPDPPPPMKNHKNIGFSSNTVPDSLKNRSYQASIQCWGIIGTPVKGHLMAFRWRAHDGPLIVVLGSFLPSSTKKKKKKTNKKNEVKVGPPLTKLSGSAHGQFDLAIWIVNICRGWTRQLSSDIYSSFVCLFVWFDSLRPINNLSVI